MMKTLKLTGMLFLAFMSTALCNPTTIIANPDTISHFRGTGLVVVVTGFADTEIHLNFDNVDANKRLVVAANIYDREGRLLFSDTFANNALDLTGLSLERGDYLVVSIDGLSETILW